jgi:hypothetical protein
MSDNALQKTKGKAAMAEEIVGAEEIKPRG